VFLHHPADDGGGGGEPPAGDAGGEGGDGAGDGTPPPAVPEGGETPPGPARAYSLGADLDAHPSLSRFEGETAEEFAKNVFGSYVNLEKKIGEKGIIPPGKEASLPEVREFFTNLGCPKDVGEYTMPEDLGLPEGIELDSEMLDAVRGVAWQQGLSDAQMGSLLQGFVGLQTSRITAAHQAQETARAEAETALKEDWGNAYPAKLQQAVDAMGHVFAGENAEILEAVLPDGTPLSRHPAFLRSMAELGDQMGEGALVGGDSPAPRATLTPAEATAQLEAMMAEPEIREAWMSAQHPKHAWVIEQRRILNEMIHGTAAPDVGRGHNMPVTGGAAAGGAR